MSPKIQWKELKEKETYFRLKGKLLFVNVCKYASNELHVVVGNECHYYNRIVPRSLKRLEDSIPFCFGGSVHITSQSIKIFYQVENLIS